MKDINSIIRENRNEAYDIIKAHGCRIDFVDGIIRGTTSYTEDDWHGDLSSCDLPAVVVAIDALVDAVVISVKCSENNGLPNGDIEFLCFDVEAWECYGWVKYRDCCNYSDNNVYMFIEEFVNKNK